MLIGDLPVPPEFEGYDEVLTHGTVDQRMALYDTGFAAGTGDACRLLGID